MFTFKILKPILILTHLRLRWKKFPPFFFQSLLDRHCPSSPSNRSLLSCSQWIHFGTFLSGLCGYKPFFLPCTLCSLANSGPCAIGQPMLIQVQLVLGVLQQILHNILEIWPPCVSQEVLLATFLKLCSSDKILKQWASYGFMSLMPNKKIPAFSV